jgi:hypothetical protein
MVYLSNTTYVVTIPWEINIQSFVNDELINIDAHVCNYIPWIDVDEGSD